MQIKKFIEKENLLNMQIIQKDDKSKPKSIQVINMCINMGGVYNIITLMNIGISQR